LALCCGVASDYFSKAQNATDPSAVVREGETVAANWPKIAKTPNIQDYSLGETGQLQVAESFPIIDLQSNASFSAISSR